MTQDRTTSLSLLPQPDVFSEALRQARTDRVVRPARRTLGEMKPGYVQQPVLRLAPNVRFLPTAASDAPCLFCDQWLCPGNCQNFAPAPTTARTALKAVA